MADLAVAIGSLAAKVASYAIVPIARRCLFKNLWEYKNNLQNLNTKLDNLKADRDRVRGFTNVGQEPDIKNWLDDATNIIDQVSALISKNNPERGCCEGCTYSNLKESYQHRNDVARKLKDVTQLLQEALRSISLWEYKSNLANLKKEVEKLEATRDSVPLLIKRGEELLPNVKLWQDNVNNFINEVSGLTSQHNHQQQNNVALMLNDVAQLLQQFGEFRKLSFRPIPEEIWLQSSEGYKAFESRTSILKQIVEALSKPDVDLVGIYGMGGIGKTTLAKQVARQTKEDKVFDKIVFAEVSQTTDTKKIQGEIGSKLGLEFHEGDELSKRARQLYQQLKKEEKTLLILDNIWESLNFETIGIPYNHDSKGLKLLMTARKNNVLTDGIEYSQHNFSIEALEWDDAWSLFKSKAGTCVDRRDLLSIAVDVAKECGGVPLAIVTIAKALNNKETYEWKTVLRELRSPSPHSFDGITANVYRSIELSYNYLETEELKATFLLCSSMGSTYDASIEDLLRYGIGLGLFNRFNTMEAERDHVCSLVSTLKSSSLLVDAPNSERVVFPNIERFAMHDVVCNVARLIARKDKNVFNVIDDVIPRYWESKNMLENCTSITLDNVNELSNDLQLVCPQLKFLYVKPKSTYAEIPDKFFVLMPKLQVLHLIELDLQPLSTPFSDLVNLQTLCLEDCMLKDIADIGDLKNLEILSFRGCNDFELPEKLHQLTKLRLLELDCIGLSSIPSKFILSFKKLEALYVRNTTIEWEAEKSNSGSRNTSRDVLEHLSNLTSLEIHVPEGIMLRGLLSPKLERYNITIGETSFGSPYMRHNWDIECRTSRFLQVRLNTNEDGIISGLKAIRQLVLDEVPGIANNFCVLDRMGFPELEDLKVQNNSHILHIVDTVSREDVFPILKSLILADLINLKTIYNGPLGMELFHQLRTIKVRCCNELTNIFSLANDRVFQELEEIEVVNCKMLKELFAVSEQVHEIKFSKLRNLRLTSLPQLVSFCCNLKKTVPILQLTSDTKPREIILEEEPHVSKPLFNEKVAVTNLETLEIKNINVNSIWDSQLPTMASIPNLTCLIISNLANLRRLGSGDYIKFPLLRDITIQNCQKFEEIFFDDKVGVPSLEKIDILNMDNLKMIWHNQCVEDSFPKLKSLQVEKCQKLSTLFRSNMCGRFLTLEALRVSKCGSLKEILDLREINSEENHPTTSTQSGELFTYSPLVLSFANLQNLNVSECRSLKTIVAKEEVEAKEALGTTRFVFPKLTSMVLFELPKLRTFYPGRYTMEWPVLKTLMMYQYRIFIGRWEKERMLQSFLLCPRLPFLPNKVGFEFQVQKIWPNLLQIMSSWVQILNRLILHGCDNLEELFPYSMVVTEELREKKTGNAIMFPKLNYLEMKQLANLKGLCSSCHIEFPTLKEFKISNCPELTAFIFDDKVKAPSLKKVEISYMDKLTKIWDNQLHKNSIPKLELLRVYGCHKVLTLLPLDMCESFSSLEIVNVSDCGSLEKIFDLQEVNSEEGHSTTSTQSKELYTTVLSFSSLQNLKVSKCGSLKSLFLISNVAKDRGAAEEMHATAAFVFPKLTSLELYKLPELRTFCPARYIVECPILRSLMLRDCCISDTDDNKLMKRQWLPHKDWFSILSNMDGLKIHIERIWLWILPMMSSSFQNLKEFVIYGCSNLKELFPSSNMVEEELREKEMGNTISLPGLEYLKIEYLANLTRLCSEYYNIEFPSLKECKISHCPELKAFIFDHKVKVPSLKNVTISSMDKLKKIWDNQLTENSIPKLESLQVCGCHKLLTLLPSDRCESFSSLKTLNVSDCGSLEKIFDLHEINSEERHYTTSTQSKELHPKVLSFANLQNLKVSECGSLKSLFSLSNVAKDRGAAEETHATATFVFPKLTSLELYKLPELGTFYPTKYTVEWPVLRRLRLCDRGISNVDDEDQMQNSLFLIAKAVSCLRALMLSGRQLMLMWQDQDPEPLFRNFKILVVLDESKADDLLDADQPVLSYIGDVKYMWKQNFKLDLILPNFENIRVGGCDNFISLMPPSASFQNLTSLTVYECNSLEHIGTFSMAKNLVKLVSLTIYRCKKIVEGLRNHGDVTGDKILFSNLKTLSLNCLPRLTSFCSQNFTLEFPSLEELKVGTCPAMKIFSQGDLTTPKLRKVKIDFQSVELCPDVDVNTAIQQFYKQKQAATEDRIDYSTDGSEQAATEDWIDYSTDGSEVCINSLS